MKFTIQCGCVDLTLKILTVPRGTVHDLPLHFAVSWFEQKVPGNGKQAICLEREAAASGHGAKNGSHTAGVHPRTWHRGDGAQK